MDNTTRRTLVLAWLGFWTLSILVISVSGRADTARAEAGKLVIVDATHVEMEPSEGEVISPPIEFHVTPTSFYVVETIGEHESYVEDGVHMEVKPGTLTLIN